MPNLIEKNRILTTRIHIKSVMDNIFKVVTKQNRMKYMNLMNFDQFLQALDVLAERMESREASHSKKFKILVQSLAKHITE
jgi:ATP-dependent exoDNAse (exonuclease V) beta subunit